MEFQDARCDRCLRRLLGDETLRLARSVANGEIHRGVTHSQNSQRLLRARELTREREEDGLERRERVWGEDDDGDGELLGR